MKKISVLFVVSVVVLVMGCQVQDQPSLDQTSKIRVENGRLVFESLDHFASTISKIDQNKLSIKNERLLDLNYVSFANKRNSDVNSLGINSILDVKTIQYLINQNNEFQADQKIYRVEKDFVESYSLDGVKLESRKNSIEYSSPRVDNNKINARQFGSWWYFNINGASVFDPAYQYYVKDRFTVVSSWIYSIYYYEWRLNHGTYVLSSSIPENPATAEYYQFTSGLCNCQYPSTVQTTYYNVSSLSIPLGVGIGNNNGVGLFTSNIIKPSNTSSFFWTSY